jgi:hypothetical protein
VLKDSFLKFLSYHLFLTNQKYPSFRLNRLFQNFLTFLTNQKYPSFRLNRLFLTNH